MKKIQAVVLVFALIMSSSFLSYADVSVGNEELTNFLSEESIEFLKNHHVNFDIFKQSIRTFSSGSNDYSVQSLNEEVLSLKRQTEANQFSDKQVQDYLIGLMSYPTKIVGKDRDAHPMADNRPWDEGIGYEVASRSGYFETTAFAKIPHAYRGKYNDTSSYMFWTLSNGTNDGIDIGIYYNNGSAGLGWRVCWTRDKQTFSPKNGKDDKLEKELYAGRNVYFDIKLTYNNSKGYSDFATIKIFDANNLTNKLCDYSIYIGGLGISRSQNNYTNNYFNRQITLCRSGANFTDGAYMEDARFWDAYIYAYNGFAKTMAGNSIPNRVGAFGTNDSNKKKVMVDNSFTKQWYAEKVSIHF